MGYYGVAFQRSDTLQLAAHPSSCTEETFVTWCGEQLATGARLAVDLFSGAGGLSLGLTEAGWTVAVAVDSNVRALETHRHNFPGLALSMDLSRQEERDRLVSLLSAVPVDLVAGGPPCQPFSRAGRSKIRSLVEAGTRDADDQRRELWRAFIEVAERVRPRAVLMENVPDMAFGDDLKVVRIIVDSLEKAGYATEVTIANASKYGVPQHRKRLIILARSDHGDFSWPDHQTKRTTVRDSISDLPRLGRDNAGDRKLPYTSPPSSRSAFATAMREGVQDQSTVWDHMTRPVRPDDYLVFQMMTSKTLYSEIHPDLRRYSADTFTDKYKRLDWDDVGRSITAHIAKDGYWYIHPEEHRTLTVREAARIQTFPDRFRFAGTRSDAFRQIGNAVPPLLGKAAATAVAPINQTTLVAASGDQTDWPSAREQLTAWATEQRRAGWWFALPGRSVTPPVAVAVVVLSSVRTERADLASALQKFRGADKLTKAHLTEIKRLVHGDAASRAVNRMKNLPRRTRCWDKPELIPDIVGLRPAETELFHLLLGNDLLLTTTQPLRVAARVAGTESDQINRMSDGRVDLARLVGTGEDAPLRMAALRLIGVTRCGPRVRKCAICPLQAWCASAGGKNAGTLF